MIYIGFDEEWKPLKYKNKITKYEISSLGRVRNCKSEKIIKQFIQNNGYYGFTISHKNKPHSFKTARIVAETFIKNPNPNLYTEVNHKNPKYKSDNSVFNLEWVSPIQNKNHAKENNLYVGKKGETNPNAKYKNKQIIKLCKYMEKNKLSLNELSLKTGVDITTIKNIYNKRKWNFISDNFDILKYSYIPININKKFKDKIELCCIMIDEGYSNKDIIEKLNVSKDCIKKLKACKTFTNISKEYNFYKNRKKGSTTRES